MPFSGHQRQSEVGVGCPERAFFAEIETNRLNETMQLIIQSDDKTWNLFHKEETLEKATIMATRF